MHSSSIVECINSILRPYLDTTRNQVSQEFLNLLMLYQNHRRYRAGKRAKHPPMELFTGQPQTADWLELLCIVDQDGHTDNTFSPGIDGTLKGPDVLFWLLNYYLAKVEIDTSDTVLFVADGARWIWKRVGAFMSSLGVAPDRYDELVDFYHAVEHVGKIAH